MTSKYIICRNRPTQKLYGFVRLKLNFDSLSKADTMRIEIYNK